jgi:hypothetical protein
MKNDPALPKLSIAKLEWNPDNEGAVPPWQLIAMTHYEYARSSKFMVQAVAKIRKSILLKRRIIKSRKPQISFANYLARQFPEFPKSPWKNIEPHVRVARLLDLEIDEQNGLYAPTPLAWKFRALSDWDKLMEEEDATQICTESLGICKIDFTQGDAIIKRQFSEWLQARRAFLLDKYDSTEKLAAGIPKNQNYRFQARPPEQREKGRGAPPNKYQLALSSLINLRAFVHSQRSVEIANKLGNKKALNLWDKNEFYAGRMLMCMESAWKCGARFIDVFDYENLKRNVGFGGFTPPPIGLNDHQRGKIELVRKFVTKNITLDCLIRE